jgi:CheY-like chemotaxis protein
MRKQARGAPCLTLAPPVERRRSDRRQGDRRSVADKLPSPDERSLHEQRDEFLATLAHELRNPLAPMTCAVELLKHVDPTPDSIAVPQEILERQLRQLVRLIDDLLDVGRIRRNKLQMRKESMDLREAVRSAVESVLPQITAAGHQLQVLLPDEPVELRGDAARLAQVVANLLTNAAQYADGRGQIRVCLERDSDAACIRVSDDGLGIAADALPRIFDMFVQVDAPADQPRQGLGVGLAIVKSVVELHGGTVSAVSEGRGCGSVFTVRLPLQTVLRRTSRKARPQQRPRRAGSRRVLVADDNRDAATAISELLGRLGHQVRTAADGMEAVEIAEEFKPEMILLDIGMPRMDGYEACKRIRALPWGCKVAIFAVTGWGQAADRRRTRAAGFTAHLVKPVSVAQIDSLMGLRSRFEHAPA